MEERELTHEESLKLINEMIGKAKDNIHESGLSPILWGSVIAICGLVTFAEIKNWIDLPISIWNLVFVALIPQIIFSLKQGKRTVTTHQDAALDYIWMTFGIGIGVLSFINWQVFANIGRAQGTSTFRFSDFSSSFYLLWYGMPGIITGALTRFKAMLFGGIFCWVAAMLSLFTSVDIDMLLTAVAAIVAWLIPGLILRKKYLRQAKKNV